MNISKPIVDQTRRMLIDESRHSCEAITIVWEAPSQTITTTFIHGCTTVAIAPALRPRKVYVAIAQNTAWAARADHIDYRTETADTIAAWIRAEATVMLVSSEVARQMMDKNPPRLSVVSK